MVHTVKRMVSALLAAAVWAVCLTGCAGSEEHGQPLSLWFYNRREQMLMTGSALRPVRYTGPETVADLCGALLEGPAESGGLVSPIPEGTRLLGWRLEEGELTLDLSQPYGDLVGIDLTLADCCLALTMTQLAGVEQVRITVNGRELPERDRQVFSPQDVMRSGEAELRQVTACLYFRRAGGEDLGFERRRLQLNREDSAAQAVIQALLAGPQEEGLEGLLPGDLEVLGVRVERGMCTLNLSGAFTQHIPDSREEQLLVVVSLAESLCSLEEVEQVRLLVEGQRLTAYGALDLSQPLTAVEP